jgi:hypothetical protein
VLLPINSGHAFPVLAETEKQKTTHSTLVLRMEDYERSTLAARPAVRNAMHPEFELKKMLVKIFGGTPSQSDHKIQVI